MFQLTGQGLSLVLKSWVVRWNKTAAWFMVVFVTEGIPISFCTHGKLCHVKHTIIFWRAMWPSSGGWQNSWFRSYHGFEPHIIFQISKKEKREIAKSILKMSSDVASDVCRHHAVYCKYCIIKSWNISNNQISAVIVLSKLKTGLTGKKETGDPLARTSVTVCIYSLY